MSARTDKTIAPAEHWWRFAGFGWLTANMLGLAAGTYPQLLAAPRAGLDAAPLPTLQCLAVAQASYLLLAYPLAILWRSGRVRSESRAVATVEPLLWLVMAGPFYLIAGYLGDAVWQDVVRVAILMAALALSARGLARAARRGGGWLSLALLAMLAGTIVGPAAYYFAAEFFGRNLPTWLWDAWPASLAWSVAQSRLETWWPRPLWAWLAWAALGAALSLLLATLPKEEEQEPV